MIAYFLLLGLLAAPGDETKQLKVTCPVDATKFEVVEVKLAIPWGGRDTDGCAHTFKTTPLESYVWVCPTCKFAGRKKDYDATLPDGDKKALLEGLQPMSEIPKGAKQAQIPGHVKYDLLAQVARIRKAPPEEVGRALLYAAWSCRQQGAVYLEDFDEWESFRGNYNLNQTPLQFGLSKNRTDFELEAARKIDKELGAKTYERGLTRLLARYTAAYLFRKHGELVAAERWVAELEKLKGENSIVDGAVAKMRASMAMEQDFLKKAAESYRSAYEGGGLEKKVAPEVAYLLGELARRAGDPKSASAWYLKAIETADSEPLKKLAGAQKALAEK